MILGLAALRNTNRSIQASTQLPTTGSMIIRIPQMISIYGLFPVKTKVISKKYTVIPKKEDKRKGKWESQGGKHNNEMK